jgi:DNA mismatch repair protein MutL
MNTTTTRPIRVLPAPVVARIAAGEVITRPRAAIRELIDNALDAGATRIDIEISGGGYDLIAVHDDGHGIQTAGAPLVLTRHATSKLDGDGALDAVATLGFRGEALASLATVAQVEIRTRHRDESTGARITNQQVEWIARQPGTSVEARGLFAAAPVRRRAAEPTSEARAIRRLIATAAVAWPHIAFTLRTEGRVTLSTLGGTLEDAMLAIYGDDTTLGLLDVDPITGPWYDVRGLASGPGASRGNRDGIVLTVNGRLCTVPEIQRAVERAYTDVLPRQRFPYVTLAITTDLCRVDVNVHPAKERVVIVGAKEIADRVGEALHTLLGRTAHRVAEKRSLALQLGKLPGLQTAETGPAYAAQSWAGHVIEAGSLPRLRLVGHVEETLIVCESDAGTLLIDQHRAHERVIYERLVAGAPQPLDAPVTITLTIEQLDLLDRQRDGLHAAGWRLTDLGHASYQIDATPPDLTADDLPHVLTRFAAEDAHSILAASACHAAIRKRRPLTPTAAVELLTALTHTPTPTTCPHGQPIIIALDRTFLEKQFDWR